MTDDLVTRAKAALEGVTPSKKPFQWYVTKRYSFIAHKDTWQVVWDVPNSLALHLVADTGGDTFSDERDARFIAFARQWVPEAAARIEADAATIARLEGERERLALAICGGEDAPGYANAQTVEALEKVALDNAAAAMWQIDRTMKAEAKVAALVEALESIERETQNVTPELMNQQMALHSTASVARAAIAAAKGE